MQITSGSDLRLTYSCIFETLVDGIVKHGADADAHRAELLHGKVELLRVLQGVRESPSHEPKHSLATDERRRVQPQTVIAARSRSSICKYES